MLIQKIAIGTGLLFLLSAVGSSYHSVPTPPTNGEIKNEEINITANKRVNQSSSQKEQEEIQDQELGTMGAHTRIQELQEEKENLYCHLNSYEKTNSILALDEQIMELYSEEASTCSLSGMKISFLGDSITAGVGSFPDEDGKLWTYPEYIADYFGCEIENLSVGGATIGSYGGENTLMNQAVELSEDTNIIFVMAGFNDFYAFEDQFGASPSEEGTYWRDLDLLIRYLKEHHPESKIILITTYENICSREIEQTIKNTTLSHNISREIRFETYMEYFYQYCSSPRVHLIDLYACGFLDNTNQQTMNIYFYDSIHPNNDGSEALGKHLIAELIIQNMDMN